MADSDVKTYWENCGKDYAHLWTGGRKSRDALYAGYKELIFKFWKRDLKDKVVIDFGCGGGFLGIFLFEKFGIRKYIGIDIAERSLKYAAENLEESRKAGLKVQLIKPPRSFKSFKADFLFSFACIQHMPTKQAVDEFLSKCNESNVEAMGLHFRHGKRSEWANNYPAGDVGLCCRLNDTYFYDKLTNYQAEFISAINKQSGAQAVIYCR